MSPESTFGSAMERAADRVMGGGLQPAAPPVLLSAITPQPLNPRAGTHVLFCAVRLGAE